MKFFLFLISFFVLVVVPAISCADGKKEALRCLDAHNKISKAYRGLSGKKEKIDFIVVSLREWGLETEAAQIEKAGKEESFPESRYDGYFQAILSELTSGCVNRAGNE